MYHVRTCLSLATAVLWLSSLALATPIQPIQLACQKISEAIPGMLHMPESKPYEKENSDYWNIALRELRPACIAMPRSAQDVSRIVTTLNEHPSVPFAIKSGGHAPSAGLASTNDGVLIALRDIEGTVYDANTQFAETKPGGHWAGPVNELAKYGRTVLGGRLGSIGIGGYLSQGGLSFLSAKHGLAADNIVEWETVLANGTIANIKASERPDIAKALRGGGNQFGIHTKFTIKTYPQGDVWVGFKMFRYGTRDAVFDALADFVENNHKNQDAAILFASGFGTSDILAAGMMLIWTGGGSPPKGAFGKFEDISTYLSYGMAVKYTTLIMLTDPFVNYTPLRASFRSFTLPHRYDDHSFYRRIDDVNSQVAQKYIRGKWTVANLMIFQPFPKSIGEASEARGGNAMGLAAADHDRVVLELATVWARKADDELAERMVHDLTATLTRTMEQERSRVAAAAAAAAGGPASVGRAPAVLGEYNPLYMNDAEADQDVMSSWKDWRQFARLQREMDPNGLWSTRAGGYKFSKEM